MFKKIIALFVVICLGLVAFVGCGEKEEKKEDEFWKEYTNYEVSKVDAKDYNFINKGKLTVAMSTDFAPFEFVNLNKTGQDKFSGSDVALAKKLAEALGVELEVKAMDFDAILTSIDNGIADVAISGFSYLPSRAAAYQFTKCYYDEGDGGQVIVIKKADAEKFTSISSMNNAEVKIAAQNGALQQELVQLQTPNAVLVKIDDLNAAYDQLKAGSLDGVAVAQTVAETLVKANNELVIMKEAFDFKDTGSFAICKKGNTALADLLNKTIDELQAKKAYEKWVEEADAVFNGLGDKAAEIIPEEE